MLNKPRRELLFSPNYSPQSVQNVSLPTHRQGNARQLSFFNESPPEVVRELNPPCKCGSILGKETLESASPHHSRLTCLGCGGWVKWVKKADSLLDGGGN